MRTKPTANATAFNPVLSGAFAALAKPTPVPVPVPAAPKRVAVPSATVHRVGFSSAAIAAIMRNDRRHAPSWRA